MTGFPINPPQAPLGSANGVAIVVSPEWYKFFLAIQRKIGSPSDPFDDSAFLAALPETPGEQASGQDLVPPALPPPELSDGIIPSRAAVECCDDRLEPYGAQRDAALSHITLGEALTRVNDTNVTLALGGSPTTALLHATSLTLGWVGTLAASRGGTGVGTLGDITRTNDTNVTLTLGGTPTGAVITSTSFTLGWTGTLAASRGGTGVAALGDITRVNDTNVTLTLGGTPTGAVVTSTSFTLGWSGQLSVARGGTGASTSTGTGSVVLSDSPTFTGTLTAALIATGKIGTASDYVTIGDSAGAGYAGIWIKRATPSFTNYSLLSDGNETFVNSGSNLYLRLSNGNQLTLDGSTALFSVPTRAPTVGLLDTNSTHYLNLTAGSNLTAHRVLTLTTGDADRTLDISAGNVTISAAAATVLDDASVAAMLATMGGAPLASPALTGDPTAPTAAAGDNDTSIATTAYARQASTVAVYRTILDSSGSHIAGRTAAKYGFGQGDPLAITGTGTLYPLNLIYIDDADYPSADGLAGKLRLRCTVACNDVAPTGTYIVGLYPVTRPSTSGAAGLNIYTIGTVVAGSETGTLTTPAADSLNTLVGSDFAIPADGFYVIGVVTTGTVAASSHMHFSAQLQLHNA